MPGFPMPFDWPYDVDEECANFDRFFVERNIPAKADDELDLASWNIANLGLQPRRPHELRLVAHILSHFDVIAVQEVNLRLAHFNRVMEHLEPLGFDMTITDTAGNSERLAVIYRTDRLRPRRLFGELDYNPNGTVVDGQYVVAPRRQSFTHDGVVREMLFYNFSRNPHLSTWQVVGTDTSFLLANVHIYYGDEENDDPARKLKFGWRLVRFGDHWAGIDTAIPNRVVGEALRAGLVPELAGYSAVRAEVKYGKNSRIDLLLESPARPPCFVEVKNVTLVRSKAFAEFPDSVTTRGAKHLDELIDQVKLGNRAVMLYLAQRADCTRFAPAGDIDPAYAKGLIKAVQAGVEVLSYGCRVTSRDIKVVKPIGFSAFNGN